jgi:MOSC domain-containing protein YiiM
MQAAIRHIFISPGHNFFGRYGQPAGENQTVAVTEAVCRAGWGIEGDRFYGYRPDYRGQVTFFAWETYEAAKRELGVPALAPEAFRRNVLIAGADLPALIGRRFTLGGVTFEGTEESKPCHWMNAVVAPGAEEWLRGHGGLRAKILSDGRLAVGTAELTVLAAEPALSPASRE